LTVGTRMIYYRPVFASRNTVQVRGCPATVNGEATYIGSTPVTAAIHRGGKAVGRRGP